MEKVHVVRHIAKAISYRFLGTMQTTIIGYIFTGSITIASSIGVAEMCIKPIMYFVHERIWYKCVKFGVRKD
jgi:uncharacterized membrane protein